MRFSFLIARRYLFSKRVKNAINIISGISVAGVAVGTMALIIVLSIFNGFDSLIKSLFNAFDPDLKITAVKGKVFDSDDDKFRKIVEVPGVAEYVEVLEENALLQYGDKQYLATVKGVTENYPQATGIDTMIYDGEFVLRKGDVDYAVVGAGVSYYLSIGIRMINPIKLWVPRRDGKVSINPQDAFNAKHLFPSGKFAIHQDFDSKYIIVSLDFARQLLDYDTELSAIEIKLKPGFEKQAQAEIQELLGDDFHVKNRFEQHDFLYKMMRSEKWATFLIFSFILLIASFNVIGSLTMLVLEKKKDISILHSMGAAVYRIRRIFILNGWFITLSGALIGMFLGFLFCWLQDSFGIIGFPQSGSYILESYPVKMMAADFIGVFVAVSFIGWFVAWAPSRVIIVSDKIFN